MGVFKKACAQVNKSHGIEDRLCDAIIKASDEIISGKLYQEHHFPLSIWQAGSGRQTNVNVNEVISNRAIQILGGQLGTKDPVHPNNHVNLSQSTNDSFSTSINIAAAMLLHEKLFPALKSVIDDLSYKEAIWANVGKVGRTHMMDAVPMTVGQQFSGYKQMMVNCKTRLESALPRLYQLSVGGNSVGTGLFSPKNFGQDCVQRIVDITGLPFQNAPNLFEAISTRDVLVELHGELNSLAVSTMKIANDIRFLASGPRCGIFELIIPENEPGSSIMPGKVNPTQCESLTMICCQVIGNQTAVTIGCCKGQFQLNAFMPMIGANVIRSITLLGDGLNNFNNLCLKNLRTNPDKLNAYFQNNIMTISTLLCNHIGYDKTAVIITASNKKNTTMREEAVKRGISGEDFDKWVRFSSDTLKQ